MAEAVEHTRRRLGVRWAVDIVVLVVLYKAYSLIQDLVPAHESVAEANARRVLALEGRLRLDPELTLNRFLAAHEWLAQASDYWYTSLHFTVSIAVALWLLWCHKAEARRLLAALYAATALALLGFWLFPLAPPRLLPGGRFVDTVVHFHTWGGWESGPVDAVANQFAALPSLHIAWSVWCAIALTKLAGSRVVRRVAWAYPAITLFVILGTGNHYLLDAVAGVVVLALGFAVAALLDAGRRQVAGRLRPPARARVSDQPTSQSPPTGISIPKVKAR